AGVVGAGDRAVVEAQRAAVGRIHPGAEREAGKPPRVLLLNLVVQLLVVGDEEEQLVPRDRPAEREPELVMAEVRRVRHRAMRRCPAIGSSSRSGPCAMATLGVSRVKLM